MSSLALESSPGLSALRSWCGWHVGPSRTETIRVESAGGRVLLLPSLHVTDVAAIRNESGDVVTGWKWRQNGIVRGTWRCEEMYEIDLTHGHDELPSELVLIVDRIDVEGVGTRAATTEAAGPFSRSFGSTSDLEAQPLSVQRIVGRYRLPPRP